MHQPLMNASTMPGRVIDAAVKLHTKQVEESGGHRYTIFAPIP